MAIPVVDFSAMGLQNKNQPWTENNNAVKDLAEKLYNAFSTVGFVYLKNHGIPQEMVRFCSNVCFVVVVPVNVFLFPVFFFFFHYKTGIKGQKQHLVQLALSGLEITKRDLFNTQEECGKAAF